MLGRGCLLLQRVRDFRPDAILPVVLLPTGAGAWA
jgi:hypothetical protein